MLVNVFGAKCIGIDAVRVTVEVDIVPGIGIHLVGLADTAVKESLLRTITSLQALGYKIPGRKIVINLAPADLRKNGSGYDLPIALGILAASDQCQHQCIEDYLIMGELGLDGSVRDVPGGLAFADMARMEGFKGCILPRTSALEAVECQDVDVYGVSTVLEALRIISDPSSADDLLVKNSREYQKMVRSRTKTGIVVDTTTGEILPADVPEVDFADIIGQESAKRAVEICCAGQHNLIMVGAPGSGKSSLAKAIPGILPPLIHEESLVTSKIYSIAGVSTRGVGLIRQRPFRAPHYSASLPAIIGGGAGDGIMPGEVSLASNGVLFLDEFGQFPKSVVEALRGPLEDRKVTISRLRSKVEYPASFMLVAASNPCPCGYFGEGDRCTCSPTQRRNYLARLSGPIMDRIDMQTWVRPLPPDKIASGQKAEPSAVVARRVRAAREIQRIRFLDEDITTNAEMTNRMIEKYCPLSEECTKTLNRLLTTMHFSMRAYFRIIKVARTIADLAGAKDIEVPHLLEAAGYRFLDRQDTI